MLFRSITTDNLLETARTLESRKERIETYHEFAKELSNDIPAVFAYSPDFIYLFPKELNGLNLDSVTIPSDRFLNVHEWYIETDRIWKFLSTEKNYLKN